MQINIPIRIKVHRFIDVRFDIIDFLNPNIIKEIPQIIQRRTFNQIPTLSFWFKLKVSRKISIKLKVVSLKKLKNSRIVAMARKILM
jgi:hypothetical protein